MTTKKKVSKKCEGITTKKKPCKKNAIEGQNFCICHSNDKVINVSVHGDLKFPDEKKITEMQQFGKANKKTRQLILKVNGEVSRQNSMVAEDYQRKCVEEITGYKCKRSEGTRIDIETYSIIKRPISSKDENKYEVTESIDGAQRISDNDIYYNFKAKSGEGGAQRMALYVSYHFIKHQLRCLLKNKLTNKFFVNILDGDIADKEMKDFVNLLNKPEYGIVKKYVYVGHIDGYIDWFKKIK